MDKIIIDGGHKLSGTIPISSSKNSSLPIIISSLLFHEEVKLIDVPNINDVVTLLNLISNLGCDISVQSLYTGDCLQKILSINSNNIKFFKADYQLVSKMRASCLILAPLAVRFGKAIVSMPGGCAIGIRPIDLHILAITSMGGTANLSDGYIEITVPNGRLQGSVISFPIVSVGATETAIMAAVTAKGTTVIQNAAKEPEIVHLGQFLQAAGALIEGLGTSTITIQGIDQLKSIEYKLQPDRIEAITYAIAAAATASDGLLLSNASLNLFDAVISIFDAIGIQVSQCGENLVQINRHKELSPCHIKTAPFPEFPTDAQAQITALLATVPGVSTIEENIFENRFMHIAELCRMGADIAVHGNKATIKGVKELKGATVMASDLRASMSLVIAGLMAQGRTEINRVYHLDRGYEFLENKLELCGAKIHRERDKSSDYIIKP
jgi:UDP-N-acetylglucosamine 1-carboxyvinyltransferase